MACIHLEMLWCELELAYIYTRLYLYWDVVTKIEI